MIRKNMRMGDENKYDFERENSTFSLGIVSAF